jgi:hypothetical protein
MSLGDLVVVFAGIGTVALCFIAGATTKIASHLERLANRRE